eukprot:5012224-Amphidinium_carterae.4
MGSKWAQKFEPHLSPPKHRASDLSFLGVCDWCRNQSRLSNLHQHVQRGGGLTFNECISQRLLLMKEKLERLMCPHQLQHSATTTTKRQKTNDAWEAKHAALWHARGGKPSALWSSTHSLIGVSTRRQIDIIDLAWTVWQQKQLQDLPHVDISQSASRMPVSRGIRSVVSASTLYSYQKDRVVTAAEHWGLLGFPANVDLHMLTTSQIRDLSGEAMGLPQVGLCLLLVALELETVWTLDS